MAKFNPYRESTNLRTVLVATLVGAFGIFLISVASLWIDASHENWRTILKDLGSLLFATVAVALLWELFAKRAFLAELMDAAHIADDIRDARLINITTNFDRGIKWENLFQHAKSVVLLCSYGIPWRSYGDVLQEFALRPSTRIQLMIPDPDDDGLLFELARRAHDDPENIKASIYSTIREFKTLLEDAPQETKLTIWYLSFAPVFTYYLFDDVVVLSLYKHRRGYVSQPAFVFERGGKLYDFVRLEHKAIMDEKDPLARQIFPVPRPPTSD
jgi:hypothetical protein